MNAEIQNKKATQTIQRFTGKVVSNKMKDTVVVAVDRFVKHSKYQKFYQITKRLKAHDLGNKNQVGDTVTIEVTKPISKDKKFRVV